MTTSDVFDCLIHPVPSSQSELLNRMEEPWRSWSLPSLYNRGVTNPPMPEFMSWTAEDGIAASNMDVVDDHLLSAGVSSAMLVPLTYGILPHTEHASAVATATNEWLAQSWLSSSSHGRCNFIGAIRVNPRDSSQAVAEIERWSTHDSFRSIVVTTESLQPFGDEVFYPIWEAAASRGLPVLILSDRIRGIGPPPTSFGDPDRFVDAYAQVPLGGVAHLASFVYSGVLERLPDLRLLFCDGGFDAYYPLMWRMTKDWRALRFEMPWVSRPPIDYISRNVKFVLHPSDGPVDQNRFVELVKLLRAESLLLYGSRYPYWDHASVPDTMRRLTATLQTDVLASNARSFFRS